jgi:hypothetical protein
VLFKDLIYFVVFSNLAHHSCLLIVVTDHFNIANDILQKDSSAAIISHGLGHFYVSKMNVKVVESRVVVKQGLDKSPWHIKLLFYGIKRVISDRFQKGQVLCCQIS